MQESDDVALQAARSLLKASADFDLKLAQEQEGHQQCLQQMRQEADASVQQEHRQADGLLAEQRRRIAEVGCGCQDLQSGHADQGAAPPPAPHSC